MLLSRLPYRLGETHTPPLNCSGWELICMHALSTIISSAATPRDAQRAAAARNSRRNMPSPNFMMLAL